VVQRYCICWDVLVAKSEGVSFEVMTMRKGIFESSHEGFSSPKKGDKKKS